MCQSEEKLKKPHSFVILRGLKGIRRFRRFRFRRFFSENTCGTFLSPIHVLPNCKKLENSNAQFWRKTGAQRQTDRETEMSGKNYKILINGF